MDEPSKAPLSQSIAEAIFILIASLVIETVISSPFLDVLNIEEKQFQAFDSKRNLNHLPMFAFRRENLFLMVCQFTGSPKRRSSSVKV
jgi:hypothetical protein